MKSLFLLTFSFFMINSFALDCKQAVQSQINSNVSDDYYVIIQGASDHYRYLGASRVYKSDADMPFFELGLYIAESSAMECEGIEYITYNKKTCELYTVGGGYCE